MYPSGQQDLPTNLPLHEYSQCSQSSPGDSVVTEQPQVQILSRKVGPRVLKEKVICNKVHFDTSLYMQLT